MFTALFRDIRYATRMLIRTPGFSIVALMAWASWALVTFVIGTLVLPESGTRSDVGELLLGAVTPEADGVAAALAGLRPQLGARGRDLARCHAVREALRPEGRGGEHKGEHDGERKREARGELGHDGAA